ncbi:MAG: diacylglycerol kinase family lipid kinase [Sphingomonadales bacterium]|nr:MAG: diacylglycerol kinase family lipid kinase [Sphingomonadales bacterium]
MTKASLAVLVNREGGAAAAAGDALKGDIEKAFEAAGVHAQVEMLAGDEMAPAIKRAAGKARIVVAGGDGTAASAAQILLGKKTELALLPLGTLNHLARDLGIPTDLTKAAALAAHGKAAKIDVGAVNDHCFVNNASIGLYPLMVKGRDDYRDRHGLPKWLAMIPASWDTLSRLRNQHLRIDMGEGEKPLVTPLLFVGNNLYSLEPGSVGSRETLQDGKLSIYAVARRSRASLLWFGMRAAVGLAHRTSDFEELGICREMIVQPRGGSVEIALDGEVRKMSGPLKFRIHAAGLRVVVP